MVNQIRKSYSLSDLTQKRHEQEGESNDESDATLSDGRVKRRKNSPTNRRHASTGIYFSELDVRHESLASVQSIEDISSGYSSGEALHMGQPLKLQGREGLIRTSSIGPRSRSVRVTRSNPKNSDVSTWLSFFCFFIFFICKEQRKQIFNFKIRFTIYLRTQFVIIF